MSESDVEFKGQGRGLVEPEYGRENNPASGVLRVLESVLPWHILNSKTE